jgi:hypothetical protein
MKFNSENLNRSKFQGKERKPDAIPNIHQGLDRTFLKRKKRGRREKGTATAQIYPPGIMICQNIHLSATQDFLL